MKELVAGEREPLLDLPHPLEHLRDEEHEAEEDRQERIRQCRPVRARAGRLDAARHGPGAHQQNEGVEDPDAQVEVRLGLQKQFPFWVRETR